MKDFVDTDPCPASEELGTGLIVPKEPGFVGRYIPSGHSKWGPSCDHTRYNTEEDVPVRGVCHKAALCEVCQKWKVIVIPNPMKDEIKTNNSFYTNGTRKPRGREAVKLDTTDGMGNRKIGQSADFIMGALKKLAYDEKVPAEIRYKAIRDMAAMDRIPLYEE